MKLLALTFFFSALAIAAPTPDKTPLVFVDQLKAESLFDLLSYPARIHPRVSATLLSETDGVVREVRANIGRPVKKGQTLFVIGNTDPVYQYAPLTVKSPIAGIVSSVETTEGSRTIKGQRLATVTDPREIRVQVEIPASDLGAVQTGIEGELRLPGHDKPMKVRVQGASPFVDPATGTASAELVLVDKVALAPGVLGRVSFKARAHDGIQVPEEAIVYRGQEPMVRIVENGKARYAPVSLGQSRRGTIEILKGVKAGDSVIIRASQYVGDGEAVSIQKDSKG